MPIPIPGLTSPVPGFNFVGSGNRGYHRQPINGLDALARRHDIAYEQFPGRSGPDLALTEVGLAEADARLALGAFQLGIITLNPLERATAQATAALFGTIAAGKYVASIFTGGRMPPPGFTDAELAEIEAQARGLRQARANDANDLASEGIAIERTDETPNEDKSGPLDPPNIRGPFLNDHWGDGESSREQRERGNPPPPGLFMPRDGFGQVPERVPVCADEEVEVGVPGPRIPSGLYKGPFSDLGGGPATPGHPAPYMPGPGCIDEQYGETVIPPDYQITVRRVRGAIEVVYVGRRVIAAFARKKAGHRFARLLRQALGALGFAIGFKKRDMAERLGELLQVGSGEQGRTNGFKNPWHGK